MAGSTMSTVSQVFVCLAVAALCGGFVRKLPIPLPLLQTAAGALLAWPLGLHLELEPETFLLVFIPPLLFIDGWRIPKREFKRFRNTILLLAFGLVVLTVLCVGLVITWCLPDVPKPVAFAIAAALSPTDAVAVSGITGRVRVPAPLMHVLQGEALMNDASGLVCLRVAVATIATGTFSWARAGGSLLLVATGGLVIGIALTWLFARASRLVFGATDENAGSRILMVMLLPYAAYLAAESVHASGILAAAASGMVFSRVDVVQVQHRASRRHTTTALGMTEVALNGLVFVLLGLQLPFIMNHVGATSAAAGLSSPLWLVGTVLVVFVAMFALRFAWVWVSMHVTIYRRLKRGEAIAPVPLRLVTATALAGVRGAVSLAAALTVPTIVTHVASREEYPAREVAEAVTAAVILLSLAAASIGLPLVLRGVELPDDGGGRAAEELPTRAALIEAALAAVQDERDARIAADPEGAEVVTEAAAAVMDRYHARAAVDDDGNPQRMLAEERALRAAGVRAERELLHRLWRERRIDDVLYRKVLRELDTAEDFLAPSPASTHV